MKTKEKNIEMFPSGNKARKPCVLIYDDDKEILFLCKAILGEDQYDVVTLSFCENVIADIDLIKPDVILMDLWIPTIGGEQAIMLLKNDPLTRDIPVIIFSANAEIKEICSRIKADGYIEKPFDIMLLKDTIRTHIVDKVVVS
ncbi:MAG: response regulator [Ferruginibacter sp.]